MGVHCHMAQNGADVDAWWQRLVVVVMLVVEGDGDEDEDEDEDGDGMA